MNSNEVSFPDYYTAEDRALASLLPCEKLLSGPDVSELRRNPAVKTSVVYSPEPDYLFLHEAAVTEYNGELFASWYNNPLMELSGRTPVRGSTSRDGVSWTPIRTIADDPSGKLLYCPPVYGECDGKLYMFINEMVGADLMHALNLYEYVESDGSFKFLWSRPIPFKLNTNVYRLDNGKLLLPGRIGEPDSLAHTPAVLISDSGKIDAEWRLVKIAADGFLPDGSELIYPELSAVINGGEILIFCRNDERNVPIIYRSHDCGETWSGPMTHNIPFSDSKIYSGTLSDGRAYAIGNLHPGRKKLAMYYTDKGGTVFTGGFLLQDGYSEELGFGGQQWSYPCACESDGVLNVIYTAVIDDNPRIRGAVLSRIPLDSLV